jgi:hypothetical protein
LPSCLLGLPRAADSGFQLLANAALAASRVSARRYGRGYRDSNADGGRPVTERRVKQEPRPDSHRAGSREPSCTGLGCWWRAPSGKHMGAPEVPHGTSASTSEGFFYDAAFAHTMMWGLVAASLGQVTVLSLIRVTGILRGPHYPIRSTSFWLHSPRHARDRECLIRGRSELDKVGPVVN